MHRSIYEESCVAKRNCSTWSICDYHVRHRPCCNVYRVEKSDNCRSNTGKVRLFDLSCSEYPMNCNLFDVESLSLTVEVCDFGHWPRVWMAEHKFYALILFDFELLQHQEHLGRVATWAEHDHQCLRFQYLFFTLGLLGYQSCSQLEPDDQNVVCHNNNTEIVYHLPDVPLVFHWFNLIIDTYLWKSNVFW